MINVKSTIAVIMLSFFAMTGMAAEKINTLERSGLFGYKESGIAIRGFDTVAYFTESKPIKGKDEFTAEWMDATWKFSSAKHRDLFQADPEKYAPQYGGWCAYGVAQDYLVKIEGDQWKIVDEKLYLNYDKKVQRTWLKDIPGFIVTANSKINTLLAE